MKGFAVICCALLLTAATAPAQPRLDQSKIAPTRYTTQHAMNAYLQPVIDSLGYVTLDSAEICTTVWITYDDLYHGYGNMATWVCDLDSGAIGPVWFEEWQDTMLRFVQHFDSTHFLQLNRTWSVTAICSTAGQWAAIVPFYGGRRFRLFIMARTDDTGFYHVVQTMRY